MMVEEHRCEFCSTITNSRRGNKRVCSACSTRLDEVKKSEILEASLENRLHPGSEDLAK